MQHRQDVVAESKRLFGDLGGLAERLREDVGEELESVTDPEPGDHVVEMAQRERERVVQDGISGLEKVAAGREHTLEPAEELGLEAIILLEGRPAILIQNGVFFPPPVEWTVLKDHETALRSSIERVGRVEVDGHLALDWVGTGFLVGPRTIMTNRHVAVEFSRNDGGDGWVFQPGMQPRLDFREEMGSVQPLEFRITGVIGIHERHDLALLSIDDLEEGGNGLPDPLTLRAEEPETVDGRTVYVVGYPAWDGRRNEPEVMRRIFMDIYNVKRLQPGQTAGFSTQHHAIQHDCSTLGGNSGSPVFDLDDHRVLALHFAGRYAMGNYAVPLWELADDPLMRAGDVNFG